MARGGSGGRRGIVGVLVLTFLVGCSNPTPTSPASSTSPGATSAAVSLPTSFSLPGGMKAGPLDPVTAAALVGTPQIDQDKMSAAAADLGTALRARVNAGAVYGQSATDLQALMDKADIAALQGLQEKVKTAFGPAYAHPVELASYHEPPGTPVAPPHVALLSVAFLLVIAIGSSAILEYNPRTGDIPPTTITNTQTMASGSATMDVTVTFTMSSAGGVATGSIALTGNGTSTNATTGKASQMTGGSTIAFTINPCPDPAGHVAGTVRYSDDETFSSSGGPTIGYKVSGQTDYVTQVDDAAEIASTQMTAKLDVATTTTTSSNGATDASTVDIAMSGTDTMSSAGTFAPGGTMAVDSVTGPAQESDGKTAGGILGTEGYGLPGLLASFAKNGWRGGKCFEVRVTPDGGTVATGSKTQVKVTVYHWVDKADVQLPVKATLAGTKAIDPNGQPVNTPTTLTFTAGAPNSTGEVTYNVTSRRGIGSKTSTFKVDGNLNVDIGGTLTETASIATYKLKVSATKISISAQADGSLSVNGEVSVTGTVTALGCTGRINQRIDVIGQVTLAGTPDAPIYRTLLGPGSTHNLGGSFSCPGLSLSSNQGDFFGQWSGAIGPVDLPAAGGRLSKTGSSSSGGFVARHATGTFIASPN